MTRGVTLIELLVVLVLLGLLFTVSGLALSSLASPKGSERFRALESARVKAIRTGTSVLISDSAAPVVFLPDGRAVGAGVDPLTGEPFAHR